MKKPVLLLVDLQHDYLSAPGLEPGRALIEERAAALLRNCREHSIPVVHVWTTVTRTNDRRMPHWKRADRWNCEEGTPGHAPPETLHPAPGERVVHKTFFSGFSSPELQPHLEQLGARTVILAGVHLHACVRQTALDAYERGFEIWIAGDAVGSDDPVHAAISRRYLERRAARFADVAELITGLRRGGPRGQPLPPAPDAAERARAAFASWRHSPPAERSALLERLAAVLEGRAAEYGVRMAAETGKPVRYGTAEMVRSAAMLRAIIRRFEGPLEDPATADVILRRRPHGVVAVITPWNNPVYIPLGKIAPAFLAGNTVVWKPSPRAGEISRGLADLIAEAGCPSGALVLVEGDRAAAEALMSDPRVDAVSITGSSGAGFGAQEICARRRIPLQAELGGNNAAIVWPDADLPDAARQIADGAFGMAGQRCTANRRVIVHRDVGKPFLRLLQDAAAEIPSGDPFRPETRIGPLVSAGERNRVAAMLGQVPPDRAELIQIDGKNFSPPGGNHARAWHPPVIVCCDDPGCGIVQEETFGPVLVVQTAADWDEAIRLCNGVRQGLVAALFSASPELQRRFLDEAQAGLLKFNRSTADAEVDVPFGGWKASGIGPPEHGAFDRDFYTRPQTCYVGSAPFPTGGTEERHD